MKPEIILKHEFVEFIPDELQQGTIYVTIRFATASHLCCCGCGSKIVTPIRPTDWKLIFDGRTISLDPSIGNWSLACQSHYWIRNNRVRWAPKWSQKQIDRGRARDRSAKQKYFSPTKLATDASSKNDADERQSKKARAQFRTEEGKKA
jgi:Family of unknown function (DUF6527)